MQEKLPSAVPDGEPLPEGLLWLLLTGDVSHSHAITYMQLISTSAADVCRPPDRKRLCAPECMCMLN